MVIRRAWASLTPLLFLLTLFGCQTGQKTRTDSQTVVKAPRRDTEAAQNHDRRGLKFLDAGDFSGAEKAFQAAISSDPLYAPAHCNLGALYYRQGKYYLAAKKYQYAAKLLPDKAGPLNNLGLVFERVGKLEDAVAAYEQALALEGHTVETRGNLARALIRLDRTDIRTRQLLQQIAELDPRPEWSAWARRELVRLGSPVPPATGSPSENK